MAVDKLVDSSQLNSDLTSVANAIRTKGGTSESLAFPSGFVSAIQNIPSGGGSVEEAKAIFIDYDGTVVTEKTKTEINAMTSDSDLPANPSHTGLVAQGWNWTVAQLKAQFTAVSDGDVYVGQMYTTTSGATEIDVEFVDSTRLSPILTIAVKGTASVDWGDGTTPDEVTGTSLSTRQAVPHTYASIGNYTIKVSKVSGNEYRFYTSNSYAILRKNNNQTENQVYTKTIKNVRIGDGITTINGNCFSYSGIETITIPNTITDVSSSVFEYCYHLRSVTLPSGITTMWSNTFARCYDIVSVSIPSSVTKFETSVFYCCYNILGIAIPNNTTSISTQVFYGCTNLKKVTLPSTITGNTNWSTVFQNCYSLESVKIPSGVTSVGNQIFYNCNRLVSVTIPSSVTSIGNSAFAACYSLRDVTLPSTIESIGDSVFSGCHSLKSITLPNKITIINSSLFSNCWALESVTIQGNVTVVGASAFSTCQSLKSIEFPQNLNSIGSSAFYNCYVLENITGIGPNTTIGATAFYGCYALNSITLPSNLTTINSSLFRYSNLQKVLIPSGVTSIGEYAFASDYVLASLTIPSLVTSIGNYAFQLCYGLKEVHVLPTAVPSAGSSIFQSTPSDLVIYVPYSADHSILTAYQTATNWSAYASYMQEEPQ